MYGKSLTVSYAGMCKCDIAAGLPTGACGAVCRIIMLINGPNVVFYAANVVYLQGRACRLATGGGGAVGTDVWRPDGNAARLGCRNVKPNIEMLCADS